MREDSALDCEIDFAHFIARPLATTLAACLAMLCLWLELNGHGWIVVDFQKMGPQRGVQHNVETQQVACPGIFLRVTRLWW